MILRGQLPPRNATSAPITVNLPTTVAGNNAAVGTAAWQTASGRLPAYSSNAGLNLSPGSVTEYLVATGAGLAVPAQATIRSILFSVAIAASNGYGNGVPSSITDYSVRVVKAGAIQAQEMAAGQVWPNSQSYSTIYYNVPNPSAYQPSDVNSANFGLALSVQNPSSGVPASPSVELLYIEVSYTLPFSITLSGVSAIAPIGSVLFDATQINGGWSSGDGIAIPLPVPSGYVTGKIQGYSLAYTGLIVPSSTAGATHGKLGKLYTGMLTGPEAVSGVGWQSFPTDPTLVSEVWDGSSDSPFPMLGSSSPVPDVRIFNVSLPQPVDFDAQNPVTLGLWLSPMLGPSGMGAVPTAALGPCTAITNAFYALQLSSTTQVPVL